MADLSSMSTKERVGYLKALGVEPSKLPSEEEPETQPKGKKVRIKRKMFSKGVLALLRKMTARAKGALNVAFHEILKARFVNVQVGMKVTVEICPYRKGRNPSSLEVCEAIESGLEHLT